jgi:putative transposase
MPYEYRQLSPEERQKIVEFRKQQGYPFHAPPHPFREAGSYLITAANFEHVPIMRIPERRTEFQEILLGGFQEAKAEVVGWVILTNHYHILVNAASIDLVSDVIRRVHSATSREWNLQDGLTGKRKVWYRFVDRMMRNETHLYRALNYIHLNPLKHKLVAGVYDWPRSSLFMYLEENGKEWLRERWRKFPPTNGFGEDWDN